LRSANHEIKRSLQPMAEHAFRVACADVSPTLWWWVYPGVERYRVRDDTWRMGRAGRAW